MKVLVEGGRKQDSHITRLYGYRDRMPVFALAYLNDALVAKGEGGGVRSTELKRRIAQRDPARGRDRPRRGAERSLPALVLELERPLDRDRAELAGQGGRAPTRSTAALVAWLLRVRKDGRWGNTQENALALEALVSYYRRFESTVPNFTAVAKLGDDADGERAVPGALDRGEGDRRADVEAPRVGAGGHRAAAHVHAHRRGDAVLLRAPPLRRRSTLPAGLGSGHPDRARATRRTSRPARARRRRRSSAGDLVRVTLTLNLTKERRFVAVTDPLPAGFEPVESWFATSAAALAQEQDRGGEAGGWFDWWQRGGFDHVERHDDRVQLFATRLSEGRHTFTYVVRATTAGSFRTAPAHAEEMYEPEVFGRTATAVIEIRK